MTNTPSFGSSRKRPFRRVLQIPRPTNSCWGCFQDLMDANKGGKYFHLSTDEAWFIGKADNDQCHETARARQLGSPSKLWAEFTQKTAGYLRDHGREVIFWGEEPFQARSEERREGKGS